MLCAKAFQFIKGVIIKFSFYLFGCGGKGHGKGMGKNKGKAQPHLTHPTTLPMPLHVSLAPHDLTSCLRIIGFVTLPRRVSTPTT